MCGGPRISSVPGLFSQVLRIDAALSTYVFRAGVLLQDLVVCN